MISLAPFSGGAAAPARLAKPTDPELLALVVRAQAADAGAQNALIRRYTRRVAGFLRALVRQPPVIEDLAQMVFIKVIRRLPYLRDPAAFESWLFTLARNTALDFLRHQRLRPRMVSLTDTTDLPAMSAPDRTREILDELDAALAFLNPIDRALVTQFVRGESYASMAARAGLTLGAVKLRLHRARPFLRSRLGAARLQRAA